MASTPPETSSASGLLHLGRVEPHQNSPLVVHPFVHLLDQRARHHGLGLVEDGQVEDLGLRDAVGETSAHDLKGVGEPLGGDQPGHGPGARDQCIVADGAGVEEQPGGGEKLGLVRQPQALGGLPHRVQCADGVVLGGGEGFAHGDRSVGVHGNAVRKGAADVDADPVLGSRISHKDLSSAQKLPERSWRRYTTVISLPMPMERGSIGQGRRCRFQTGVAGRKNERKGHRTRPSSRRVRFPRRPFDIARRAFDRRDASGAARHRSRPRGVASERRPVRRYGPVPGPGASVRWFSARSPTASDASPLSMRASSCS